MHITGMPMDLHVEDFKMDSQFDEDGRLDTKQKGGAIARQYEWCFANSRKGEMNHIAGVVRYCKMGRDNIWNGKR